VQPCARRAPIGRKTAIVTGGYAGIGLETTRLLAAAGAAVTAPARDFGKGATSGSGSDSRAATIGS
jgi:NAD(P)-dependent dehydrogenase (short-subunit alcohol dehydrogenase family)